MILDDNIQIGGVEYQICGQIGEGGVGKVFIIKAEGKKFALKVISQYGRNPVIKQMVNQEIKTQQLFAGNPHIIQIIDYKEQNKMMNIIFELGTCSLRNRMTQEGHVELREFLDILLDTSKGLMAIHSKNLIHRDIKPENIICVEKTYKITDFGSLQTGTVGEGVIGTPLYLPPEMLFEQEKEYDQKIDIWSLGVSLFQVYFHIHPFYYDKYEEQKHADVFAQLKQNIKALTPNFTMDKFVKHLLSKGRYDTVDSIHNKLKVTNPEIIDQFAMFFADKKERPDIEYFVGIFESLEQSVREGGNTKQVQVKAETMDIPSDIQFYIQTLNSFYELSSRYWTDKFDSVEFHLELGMWYWNFFNYVGTDYVDYYQKERLKAYKKDRPVLWEEVQHALFDYWCELSSNEELTFYENLSTLKIRILICGARFSIYNNLNKFLRYVSAKINMDIGTLEQLQSFLSILEVAQLKKIEDTLINNYYG